MSATTSKTSLGAVIVPIIVGGVILAILQGWVAALFWQWFISAPFEVAKLNVPEAMGVMLLVRFVIRDAGKAGFKKGLSTDEKIAEVFEELSRAFGSTCAAGFCGWVIHQFV